MKLRGHQKLPDHKVRDQRVAEAVKVGFKGVTIAESSHGIQPDDDEAPVRYHFARREAPMEPLRLAPAITECPCRQVEVAR